MKHVDLPDRDLAISLLDDAYGKIAVARQLLRGSGVDEIVPADIRRALDIAGYVIVRRSSHP